MDISAIGRASAYVKSWELGIKWRERKQNPMKAKEDEDPQVAELKRRAQEQRKSNAVLSLQNKMMSGMRLTAEEMEYLRENSPEDYEKAVKLEKEREEYKRELRQCRSKEDVEKLNTRRLQRFGAEAKSIRSNPNIPEAKKKELLDFLHMKMKAFMDEHAEFVNTPEYQRLPEKDDRDKALHSASEYGPSGSYEAPGRETGAGLSEASDTVKPNGLTVYGGGDTFVSGDAFTSAKGLLYTPGSFTGGDCGSRAIAIEA